MRSRLVRIIHAQLVEDHSRHTAVGEACSSSTHSQAA
jgi:hypothetical protein